MATQPNNRGEVLAFPGTAPMPAVARILSRFERGQLEAFLAVAIDLLDVIDGDADKEDEEADEAAGDEHDAAWIEWTTMHGSQKRGPNRTAGDEDDEDDDNDSACDDHAIDEADQGDLENDLGHRAPKPAYAEDQRQVLHRPSGRVIFEH